MQIRTPLRIAAMVLRIQCGDERRSSEQSGGKQTGNATTSHGGNSLENGTAILNCTTLLSPFSRSGIQA
jgi:hypothetical protein